LAKNRFIYLALIFDVIYTVTSPLLIFMFSFENLLTLQQIFAVAIHAILTTSIMMKSYSKTVTAPKITTGKPTIPVTKAAPKKKGVKTEEAQEVAGFLLSLKNQRSVSPDPNDTPTETMNTTEAESSEVNAATEITELQPATMIEDTAATSTETTTTNNTATSTTTDTPVTVSPPTPIPFLTTTATPGESTSSSTGAITGYAGPPPILQPTAYTGMTLGVYPSYPYNAGATTITTSATSTTSTSNTPTKKNNPSKEKKLKKTLFDVGTVPMDDVTKLKAMIDDFVQYDLTKFIDDSNPLVQLKDRDFVPDSLFVAMLQMKVCYLTQADRVGCYKTRDLGFIGMCCKHCNGQPGFGRYFPNSVRSLAQTTTSQTILKHIASKCRFCPPNVREVVVELQRQQTIRDALAVANGGSSDSTPNVAGTTSTTRPRYGSRKIFFHRVWSRLHAGTLGIQTNEDDIDDDYEITPSDHHQDNVSMIKHDSLLNEEGNTISSSIIEDAVTEAMSDAAIQLENITSPTTVTTSSSNKRTLPIMGKNKRLKVEEDSTLEEI
jgi:hypothetical protein